MSEKAEKAVKKATEKALRHPVAQKLTDQMEETQFRRDLEQAAVETTREKEAAWIKSGEPLLTSESDKLKPSEAEVWDKMLEIRGRRLRTGESLAKDGRIIRKEGV